MTKTLMYYVWCNCIYLCQCGDQQTECERNLRHRRRIGRIKAAGRAADANRDEQKCAQTFGDQDAPDVAVVRDVGDADDALEACGRIITECL